MGFEVNAITEGKTTTAILGFISFSRDTNDCLKTQLLPTEELGTPHSQGALLKTGGYFYCTKDVF